MHTLSRFDDTRATRPDPAAPDNFDVNIQDYLEIIPGLSLGIERIRVEWRDGALVPTDVFFRRWHGGSSSPQWVRLNESNIIEAALLVAVHAYCEERQDWLRDEADAADAACLAEAAE